MPTPFRAPLEPIRLSRPVRLAIVDDESSHRQLLRRMCERLLGDALRAGVEGCDGDEAIALRFADPTPDLMFINGFMPKVQGQEAIRQIRTREAVEGLPRVLIVINSGEHGWCEAGIAAGADAHLCLPFGSLDLRELLQRLLSSA